MNADKPASAPRHAVKFALGGSLLLLALLGIAVEGTFARLDARAQLARSAVDQEGLSVSTVTVAGNALPEVLSLPATAQPYIDAPIYARTSGYVKRWLVDLGASVARDQLLAELDTPEVDQQLRQAQANEASAKANAVLAERTAVRYRQLLATHVVAQQSADEKFAAVDAAHAALDAAHADVARLRELEDFKLIRAPFAGIVTARKIDVGTLVNAAGSSATQLFQLAALDRVRVFVPVPQTYAALMRVGLPATVTFATRREVASATEIARTANVIDAQSRTLLVELEVDNPSHEALAGAYVEVKFKLAASAETIQVPAATLMFRAEGVRVASIDTPGKVKLLAVELGRDFGTAVEVLSGVAVGQQLIMNPPDALADGQTVQVVPTAKSP